MLAGLTALGTTLGITQITPALFTAALTAFTNTDQAFAAARGARQTASDAFTTADGNLTVWLGKARLVLATQLGAQWSTLWVPAGFTNNTTQVPVTIVGRLTLAAALVTFFTANPSYEQVSVGVTATAASDAHYFATLARAQFQAADAAAGTVKATRAVAETALRTMMRFLINILTAKLGPDDARWDQFGLNRPAADVTPGQPQDFAAVALGDGTLGVGCAATALATRYRWRIKVVGVDTAFRLGLSTQDPMGIIAKVEAGQTVECYVQAVNGQAQSVPSDTVTVLVTAAPALPAALPPMAEKSAPAEKNGNGNGHRTNGARSPGEVAVQGR